MPDLGSFGQWAFFEIIFALINSEIESFLTDLLERGSAWVAGMALTLLTLWVLSQGYLIVTGRSRESLMGLVVGSLRAYLIIIAATTLTFAGTNLVNLLTEDVPGTIHYVVTGDDGDVEDSIDNNLKMMGLIFALMDALPVEDDPENADAQKSIITMTGIGIAGPSVVGGAMLLLYKIALVLFVGFGPIFILCLLFDQTKELFKRWLLYGIGTMFSLAVLAFMVSVATKLVAVSALAMIAAYTASGAMGEAGFGGGLSSAAVQQGGIGLLMSVLMVMAPPIAAMFFSGTLGQFVANSSFGNVGRNSTGQDSDFRQRLADREAPAEPPAVTPRTRQ